MLINIFITLTYTIYFMKYLYLHIYIYMHSHSWYYQCDLNRWSKCSFNYVNYNSVNIVSCAFTATDIMLSIRGVSFTIYRFFRLYFSYSNWNNNFFHILALLTKIRYNSISATKNVITSNIFNLWVKKNKFLWWIFNI